MTTQDTTNLTWLWQATDEGEPVEVTEERAMRLKKAGEAVRRKPEGWVSSETDE